MVDQFKRTLFYPSSQGRSANYPSAYPGRLSETQSPVPSQDSPQPPPYDPSKGQADIGSAQNWSPPVPRASIVRASFDSRPPMGYDWFWEDKYEFGIAITPAFIVPAGYVLIIRGVNVEIFPADAVPATQMMNEFGDYAFSGTTVNVPKLIMLINETPSTFWTQTGGIADTAGNPLKGVPLYNACLTAQYIPMFIPVEPGSTVRGFIPNFTSRDGTGVFDHNTYIHYYGNMLLSTGRPVVSEVGNAVPLPVQVDDREYI